MADVTEVTTKKVILKNMDGEYLIPYTDPIPVVTTSADGLMSTEDKQKLDDLDLIIDTSIYANRRNYSKNIFNRNVSIYSDNNSAPYTALLSFSSDTASNIEFNTSSNENRKTWGKISCELNGLYLYRYNRNTGEMSSCLQIKDPVFTGNKLIYETYNDTFNYCLSAVTDSTTETTLACQGWVNTKLQNYVDLTNTQTITGEKTFYTTTTKFKGTYDYNDVGDFGNYKDEEFKHIIFQDTNGVESGFISHHLNTPYNMFEIGIEHNDLRSSIMHSITDDNQSAIWVNADRFMIMGGGTGHADVATQGFVEDAIQGCNVSMYQKPRSPSLWSGKINVELQDDVSIYDMTTASGRSAFITIDTSALTKSTYTQNGYTLNKIITFEMYFPASSYTDNLVWPGNIFWMNGERPTIEVNKNALFAFRSFDGGITWLGNMQCSWDSPTNIAKLTFNFQDTTGTGMYFNSSDMTNNNLTINGNDYMNYLNGRTVNGASVTLAFAKNTSITWSCIMNASEYNAAHSTSYSPVFNPSGGTFTLTQDQTITLNLTL